MPEVITKMQEKIDALHNERRILVKALLIAVSEIEGVKASKAFKGCLAAARKLEEEEIAEDGYAAGFTDQDDLTDYSEMLDELEIYEATQELRELNRRLGGK